MCNDTITVFNAKLNPTTGNDDYYGTVISGVSWYCKIKSAVDDGLKAANEFTVRIPENADFGSKSYVSPLDFAQAEDISGLFTLKNGDIVVHGAVTTTGLRPAALHKDYEAFTVLGVTDDRRAPHAPQWVVIGS